MSQTNTLEVKGLYTNPNELTLPAGALLKADNVVIDRPNMFQSRRGFEKLPIIDDYTIPGDTVNSLFEYMNTFIAHSDNIFGDFPGLVSYYNKDLSQWVQLDNGLLKPEGRRPRFAGAGGSAFFTTEHGVYKLDTLPTTPYISGGIKALSGVASPAFGSGIAIPDGVQVAYRVLWGYKDAQKRTILGVPSQRIILINNTGATKNGLVRFYIPKTVTTADFYQVYRSGASASITDPPDDNMGLVFEGNPTNIDIDNGYIEITDITPDALIGPALYTNPNQTDNGIADANEPPPFAKDITVFKGSMFYANTVGTSRIILTLLAAQPFQKLTIHSDALGNATFTGGADETGTSPNFTYKVFTTGTPTENIANTAISLVNQINKLGPDYPVTAYYVSGPNELPGKILIESGILNDPTYELSFWVDGAPNIWNSPLPLFVPSVFPDGEGPASWSRTGNVVTLVSNRDGAFYDFKVGQEVWVEEYPDQEPPESTPDPNFPYGMKVIVSVEDNDTTITYNEVGPNATSTTRPGVRNRPLDSVKTEADTYKNGIYFSKFQEYEAVPLGQVLFAGNEDDEILRIAPLRDSLIILKTDGIYRITGTDASNFALYTLDDSVRLIAPDTVQVIQNQVVAYTNQGIVAITDSGVTVISSPIEQSLLDLIGLVGESVIANTAFAVSYETDRKYIVFLPNSITDTQATQAFAYNIFTQTWTRWTMTKSYGIVSKENDKLYLASNAIRNEDGDILVEAFVSEERKNYTYTDFADESFPASLSNEIGTFTDIIEFSSLDSFNKCSVGDVIYGSSAAWGIIVEKIFANNTVRIDKVVEVTPEFVIPTIFKGIHCTVAWAPITNGVPAESKDFTEIQFYARRATAKGLQVMIANEASQSYTYIPKETGSLGQWGLFPWGDTWDMKPRIQNFRIGIPIDLQVCAFLYLGLDWYSTFSYFDFEGLSVKVESKNNSRSTNQ